MQWEDLHGRVFKAKLVDVGTVTLKLENEAGKRIDYFLADLKPSSKMQALSWQRLQDVRLREQAYFEKEARPSIFDKELKGNLLIVDGERLKNIENKIVAKKYYIFFYTASWCPPCQKLTLKLVDWYKKNKNDSFELILITSDRNEEAMKNYAISKSLPWPQLKFSATLDFKLAYQADHKAQGIPSLIVCSIDGEVLGNYRGRLNELRELVH
jgi:nucleoredoxin